MADDLPPGYTLREASTAPPASGLPEGYTLRKTDEEISKAREDELRAKYRERLLPKGGQEPGYGERFLDNLSYGVTRPLAGLATGVQGFFSNDTPGSTFGERYRAGVGATEDYYKKAEENSNDWGGTAADIAGSILAPVPVGKVVQAGSAAANAGRTALGKVIAHGATQGAIEGATHNAKDVESALEGAATGAALGGATSAVVGTVANKLPGFKGAAKEANEAARGASPEELRAAAKTGFKALDNAGVEYAGVQTNTLKKGIDDLIANNEYNKIAHGKISGYVDELSQKAAQPQGMKFTELSNLRSALATEARGSDESTRTAAKKVIAEIDKMVEQNHPATNPTGIDVKGVHEKARSLWRSAALADDVNWAATKAERKASVKAGVNPDEANRDAFRQIQNKIDKPGAYSPYGPKGSEQRKLLAKIVQGDVPQNIARGAGAVAGSPALRIGAGLGAAALGYHGGLGTVASALGGGAAVGGGVKNMLDRYAAGRGAENINALIRSITGSEARAPSEAAQRWLLAKQLAQRAPANYFASGLGENQPPERLRVTRDAQ